MFNYENHIYEEYREEKLPEIVKKANKSLRKAANHLSLALMEDNRFLFLGDVENFEIKQIINDLKLENRIHFYIFITSHHGTHRDDSLKEIKCIYLITSNGKYSQMNLNFKEISKISLATQVNSDIVIPIHPTENFYKKVWWLL